jgi:hypothetical protein
LTGVIDAKVLRAADGTRTRGRNDASAPRQMQPIPRGIAVVACKGRAWLGALLDDLPISTFDPDPIRGEYPAVVRIAAQPLKYRSGFQRIHRHCRTVMTRKSPQIEQTAGEIEYDVDRAHAASLFKAAVRLYCPIQQIAHS